MTQFTQYGDICDDENVSLGRVTSEICLLIHI